MSEWAFFVGFIRRMETFLPDTSDKDASVFQSDIRQLTETENGFRSALVFRQEILEKERR